MTLRTATSRPGSAIGSARRETGRRFACRLCAPREHADASRFAGSLARDGARFGAAKQIRTAAGRFQAADRAGAAAGGAAAEFLHFAWLDHRRSGHAVFLDARL